MKKGTRKTPTSQHASSKIALPQHALTSERTKHELTRNLSKQSISKNNPLQRTLNTQTHSPSSQQTSSQIEEQTKHIKLPTEKITEQPEREE